MEWPIFKNEYLECLADEQKSGGSKSSQPGYLTALYKHDERIFEDQDFPTLYYKAFPACDYSECKRLRNWYVGLIGKNGVDCYSKNGHAVTVLTRQS